MTNSPLRIATRASRLALRQATFTAGLLTRIAGDRPVQLVEVHTAGDHNRSAPLHELGGAGLFTREVQRAVLDGRADIAVHSLKDLPTEPVDGLLLAAVPARASCFDALVLPRSAPKPSPDQNPDDVMRLLENSACIGTGSLRRAAQLRHHWPRLQIAAVRGNVETRLRKLDKGEFAALVLAEAGLTRLELPHRISLRLQPPVLFPAVGQGALGMECRTDDEQTRQLLQQIDDAPSRACVTAERSLLAELRAGCHAPLGALAEENAGGLMLQAVVLSRSGRERLFASAGGRIDEPRQLGRRVAEELRRQGADRLISECA